MPATHFGDSGNLPWGKHFYYTKSNINVPNDHRFFVTVVYSGTNSYSDQYLRHWMGNHPALRNLQSRVNYREITTADPIYRSYLNVSVAQVPAILVTTAPTNGPFGKTVYLAYGSYLPTDPNEIAAGMEQAMQNYEPQVIQQVPPTAPLIDVDIQRQPPETTVVQQPPEPNLPPLLSSTSDAIVIALLIGVIALLIRKR